MFLGSTKVIFPFFRTNINGSVQMTDGNIIEKMARLKIEYRNLFKGAREYAKFEPRIYIVKDNPRGE